jgi:hypothetical protein
MFKETVRRYLPSLKIQSVTDFNGNMLDFAEMLANIYLSFSHAVQSGVAKTIWHRAEHFTLVVNSRHCTVLHSTEFTMDTAHICGTICTVYLNKY